MRALVIIFLFTSSSLFSQDTTVAWIKNIDTTAFKLSYSKKGIPKKFYKYIWIHDTKEIANPTDKWQPSCMGKISYRLNWIATDKNNHMVISISHGGKGPGTNYYCFDEEKGKFNMNILRFPYKELSLSQVVDFIKRGYFKFDEIDLLDYEEE